jgi:spore germination cell wall hydrolase CwlJ-like protein
LNIYHEARGESIEGQIAVAQVTVNRASHDYFPDTVCEVVWDEDQFSWTNDGRSDRVRDLEAYRIAVNIAEWVLLGKEDDPTNGSLFYHADRVSPFWARKVDFETKIGDHVFYTWSGRW